MVRLGPTSLACIGEALSLGCQSCELLEPCGGVYQGWNCFSDCCGEPIKCKTACLRSHNFSMVVRDAGGFDINRLWLLKQTRSKLPTYIPKIDHGYRRSGHLATRNAALSTFDVLRVGAKSKGTRISNAVQLREHFKISPRARVLLLSIAKDNRLENYWKHEVSHRLPEQLASLGIQYVTAPNYSFPLNVPRPEHLVNRRRSLVSAERLSAVGLRIVPHLNAVTQKDWDCWRDFLRDHPHLFYVALEFQTGLRIPIKAKWHLSQLLNLQEALGRELHLIAVAGRRHIRFLSELPSVTVVDSVPFIKAHKRRKFQHEKHQWVVQESPQGEPLDALLSHNVRVYGRAVTEKLNHFRMLSLELLSSHENIHAAKTEVETGIIHDDLQLAFRFWPTSKLPLLAETVPVSY